MGTLRLSLGLVVTASCGRFGFVDGPPADGNTVGTLRCGAPIRFQVGAGAINAIASVGTPDGFAMFTATADQLVHGWLYTLDGDGGLAATIENLEVATSETAAIGAAGNGSELVLSAAYGMPATGTALVELDNQLAPMNRVMRDSDIAAADPIAARANGYAFVTMGQDVTARLVAPAGTDAGAPVTVAGAAESPSDVAIIAAAGGFAVAYHAALPAPNRTRAVLLDANLAIVAGPVTTSDLADNAYSPRAAWAASSNVLLVAWHEKSATTGDDVWFQLLAPDLSPITPPTLIAPHSVYPQVATDGTAFWLTWKDNSTTPASLAAARVDATGTVTPRAVTTSGGSPGSWVMLERAGQPILVWTEIGGSGPDLYIDPMCD